MKKLLSMLLVLCMIIGMLSTVSFAADPTPAATNYHIFTDLPSGEGSKTNAVLYLGAPLSNVFHGMNGSGFSSGSATTSTDVAAQNKIAIIYGGVDATYGTYYYMTFTLPNGTAYAVAYGGGYFTQNKLTNGLPSGGFAYKHRLYWNADEQLFYHRVETSKTTVKALRISKTSFKFFTDTVANVVADRDCIVRVYEQCKSNNIAGSNATHVWSGVCTCGYKFDYREKTDAELSIGFHQVTELPTASKPEISGDLRLGAVVSNKFYGLSGASILPEGGTRYFPTTDVKANMCTISLRYGGNHATYGDYYYVIFTLPNGTAYALSYTSGYLSNNMLQANGEPIDGWQDKNRMYYDQTAQTFYRAFEASGETVTKGLKLSTTSHNVFTETLANLRKANSAYVPVRLYARCTTNGPADRNNTHHWDGECSCGNKVGYAAHDELTDWNVKTAEGHGKICSCGFAVEQIKPHDMPEQWTTDPETGLVYRLCTACSFRELKDHTHAYSKAGFDSTGHWSECICGEKTETVPHSMGQWTWEEEPTILAQTGTQKRNCEQCAYVETRENTLSAAEFVASENPPAANVPFYLGTTQLKIANTPTYFFKGVWAPSKYQNMDVTTDMYGAMAMYAEETQDGYKLYFDNQGVKTYLVVDHMTVSESQGVFVQPVTDASKASAFKWNTQYATFQTNVAGRGDYYIGLYTGEDTNGNPVHYTKMQALLVSGLGRDDRFPSKIYMKTGSADHTHSFGDWIVVSTPTTLQEQGKQTRSCHVCGYEEIRITTLDAEEFKPSANPPANNVPFYLGATQKQVQGKPTYFFKGVWAPSKYLNMDVSTDMYGAMAMYAEETQDGYKLYFDNQGVKTYLVLDYMTVNGSKGVFVQPVTSAKKAAVFKWNIQYATFQTNVAGRGDYYIGLYTDENSKNETVAYTKLQALLVSGLGRDDRHPSKVYMRSEASDHKHSFGAWNVLSVAQNLQEQGKQKRKCSICGYEEIRVTALSANDFKASANPPATNVPFYLGATQRQIKGKPTYFFKGEWAPKKYLNMDVSTEMENATAMYAEAVNGGYKLYFYNAGVKTYLVLAEMTVSKTDGVFVQPVKSAKKATVFIWNQEYKTFQTNVPGRGDYYIGLYTADNGTAYTKLQALLVSGLGRDDRHPSQIYLRTYDHKHTFGKWVSKSRPTHLNDQGVQERACTGCDYVQGRAAMLSPSDYVAASKAPSSGKSFYLGATQYQIADQPEYFFLGAWLPRKFQRMDVTADMKKSALMYTQAVKGGYKLYFIDEGVKTYLMIAEMTVEGDRGVFVQPVTEADKASVFQWNKDYCTYQTSVAGKGEYCIGNYTVGDIKYTKLSALLVSDLDNELFHPAVPYILR